MLPNPVAQKFVLSSEDTIQSFLAHEVQYMDAFVLTAPRAPDGTRPTHYEIRNLQKEIAMQGHLQAEMRWVAWLLARKNLNIDHYILAAGGRATDGLWSSAAARTQTGAGVDPPPRTGSFYIAVKFNDIHLAQARGAFTEYAGGMSSDGEHMAWFGYCPWHPAWSHTHTQLVATGAVTDV